MIDGNYAKRIAVYVVILLMGITSLTAQSVTFDIEDLEGLTRWPPKPGPFMFYHVVMGHQLPFFAWTGIDWNEERTVSTLVDTDGLDDLIDEDDRLSLVMTGFDLHSFSHINVINPGEPIEDGKIGDFRIYTGGHGYIEVNQQRVIRFKNLQVEVLVHYPEHVLPVKGPGDYTEAYGFGDIDKENSEPAWVEKFDLDTGQVDFVFESFTSHIDEPDFYDGTVRVEGKEYETTVASHIIDEEDDVVDFLDEVGLKFDFEYIEPASHDDNYRDGPPAITLVAYKIFDDGEGNLPEDIPSFNHRYYYRVDAVAGDFECSITFDLSGLTDLPDDLSEIVILSRPVTGCPDVSWEKISDDLEVVSLEPPKIKINNIEEFGEMAIGSLEEGTLPVDFDSQLPDDTILVQAYPNPFNIETNIGFQLPEPAQVTINIYNTKGQLVNKLIDSEKYSAGQRHTVRWDGKDKHGSVVSSGVYLYVMETGEGYRISNKVLLLK